MRVHLHDWGMPYCWHCGSYKENPDPVCVDADGETHPRHKWVKPCLYCETFTSG